MKKEILERLEKAKYIRKERTKSGKMKYIYQEKKGKKKGAKDLSEDSQYTKRQRLEDKGIDTTNLSNDEVDKYSKNKAKGNRYIDSYEMRDKDKKNDYWEGVTGSFKEAMQMTKQDLIESLEEKEGDREELQGKSKKELAQMYEEAFGDKKKTKEEEKSEKRRNKILDWIDENMDPRNLKHLMGDHPGDSPQEIYDSMKKFYGKDNVDNVLKNALAGKYSHPENALDDIISGAENKLSQKINEREARKGKEEKKDDGKKLTIDQAKKKLVDSLMSESYSDMMQMLADDQDREDAKVATGGSKRKLIEAFLFGNERAGMRPDEHDEPSFELDEKQQKLWDIIHGKNQKKKMTEPEITEVGQ